LRSKSQECEELKNRLTILDGEILVVEITQEEYKNYINQKQVLEDIKNYCKDVKFDFGSKPVAIDILKIIEKGQ
jgi:hypothetical protein